MFEIVEAVHVEYYGDHAIVLDFAPGVLSAPTDDELVVIQALLLPQGVARVHPADQTPPPPPPPVVVDPDQTPAVEPDPAPAPAELAPAEEK
jgi:hypothetical protein